MNAATTLLSDASPSANYHAQIWEKAWLDGEPIEPHHVALWLDTGEMDGRRDGHPATSYSYTALSNSVYPSSWDNRFIRLMSDLSEAQVGAQPIEIVHAAAIVLEEQGFAGLGNV